MTKKTNLLICLAILLNFCCYPILSADVDLNLESPDILKVSGVEFASCLLFFILWYFIAHIWQVVHYRIIDPISKWKKATKSMITLNKIQAWWYFLTSIAVFSVFLIKMIADSPAQPILKLMGFFSLPIIFVIMAIFLFLQIKVLAILCIELIKWLYYSIRRGFINV
jgi:hypothetical protein